MTQKFAHRWSSTSHTAVAAMNNPNQTDIKGPSLSKSTEEHAEQDFPFTSDAEEEFSEEHQDSEDKCDRATEEDYAQLAKLHIVDMETLRRTTRDVFDTDSNQGLAMARAAKAAEAFDRLGKLDPIQEMLLHQMISVSKVFLDCGAYAAVTPDKPKIQESFLGKMVKLGNLFAKQVIVFDQLRQTSPK